MRSEKDKESGSLLSLGKFARDNSDSGGKKRPVFKNFASIQSQNRSSSADEF